MGIVDVPADTNDPRAQTYIVDHVEPGATFTRRFQVCNGTSAAVMVNLYAGAATITDGAFRVTEGRAENELSSWIDVDPSRLTLQPGRRELVTARFNVPTDAEPGEQYGVLLAELPAAPGSGGVAVANRVGVRVYLNVGDGGAPRSDFRVDFLQASRTPDGRPLVTALVHNTGGRALDLSGSLSLTDGPGGLSGGPFPAELGTTLAPGDTGPVRVPLDKAISGGPWTATLTLRSGLLERQARAQLTFPDQAGAEADAVVAENLSAAEDPKILVPIASSLILLILLALLWWLIARRRTKRQDHERDAEQESVPAG